MSIMDIRNIAESEIETIRFADIDPAGDSSVNADQISLDVRGCVFIEVSEDSGNRFAYIRSKEDAENLIKALQKAIELGWWQDKPAGVSE